MPRTLSLALIEYALVPLVKTRVSLPPTVAVPVSLRLASCVAGTFGAVTPSLFL
jgi:hypothetical protein